ncbi:hypothetical protein C8J56DRAFT_774459 [Mycena floridula]|nr:hypothetical protein C8J56DRAFT_774459 [Mycena floridula]
MHKNEPVNFLRFATAIKLLFAGKVSEANIQKAEQFLTDYLLEYRFLYGAENMKPNQHWIVHTPDHLRDFGPMYNFWAFLTERLNKVLKNYNSNNQFGGSQDTGGRVEMSMMREFNRAARVEARMHRLSQDPSEHWVVQMVLDRLLRLKGNAEAIGTVADAATLSAGTLVRSKSVMGKAVSADQLNDEERLALKAYYNSRYPTLRFHLELEPNPLPGSLAIVRYAPRLTFARLDGRRISPTSQTKRSSPASSIIKVKINGKREGGEIRELFTHQQDGVEGMTVFARIDWMIYADLCPVEGPDPWAPFSELEIETWQYRKFYTQAEASARGLPYAIPLHDILCQLARGVVRTTDPALWITTTMSRVSKCARKFRLC